MSDMQPPAKGSGIDKDRHGYYLPQEDGRHIPEEDAQSQPESTTPPLMGVEMHCNLQGEQGWSCRTRKNQRSQSYV